MFLLKDLLCWFFCFDLKILKAHPKTGIAGMFALFVEVGIV